MPENTKPPLFSPVEDTVSNNDRIGNCTIDKAIGRNYRILSDCALKPLFEKDDYSTLLDKISHAIRDPVLQAALEQEWKSEEHERELARETIIFLEHFKFACLYVELARTAEERNEHTRAWAFNNYASLLVGGVVEKLEALLGKMDDEKRSKRNSENGKGRIKDFLPIKEEAARLLIEMRPDNGWPTIASAVAALEEPIARFITEKNITTLSAKNTWDLLEKNWLVKDELVNKAWRKSRQPKNNHKP